ncbi:MAG: tRNA uridine(34) 5-carboxymethylaminomethyl modification radical SAM/GNAT enzyme Elp3 [Methanobacteriota archaeon]|nr:MAG: tRNA uridine(34) 5-carboxymethylaminomethyl modification radical SAM/GNAT enzyme Elp3 [Euryarchaeota archaeon]
MDQAVYEEIAREILEEGWDVQRAKNRVCQRHGLHRPPSNTEILNSLSPDKRELLLHRLRKKPVRTLSGVAVVAVMTDPAACPHGRCLYCPRGDDAPQSYTGFEPASLRAKRAGYDPFEQVYGRLRQLHVIGHNVEKTELIVMGGTFPAREPGYQEWFIKRSFDAMNSFGASRRKRAGTLEEAHRLNEKAAVRNVGVTVETRPDFAKEAHVDRMLRLGVTRVELGVQTLRDDVLEKAGRGHDVADVIEATRIVKDSGLKIGYHMMPGLFTEPSEDLHMFRRLFAEPDFRPDMLKIYPTLVLRGTGLYEMWEKGRFRPLTDEECIDLIVEIKKTLPKWVRTMRIQRDIPAQLIAAGVRKGNLGELVQERLEQEGVRCRCIRCRDIGHLAYKEGIAAGELEILVEGYESSGGNEIFISAEDTEKDALAGYLRLRYPSAEAHRPEMDRGTAVVRELKVLGRSLRIGQKEADAEQHRGVGKGLLERAMEVAAEDGRERILITSAVGTREYYGKLGFRRLGPYMVREL